MEPLTENYFFGGPSGFGTLPFTLVVGRADPARLVDPARAEPGPLQGALRSHPGGPATDAHVSRLLLPAVSDGDELLLLARSRRDVDGSMELANVQEYELRTFQRAAGSKGHRQGGGDDFILAVALFVPDAAARDDCRRWLDDEHAGRQLAVDGAFWFAGYEATEEPFNFLNLWGVRSPDVIESEAWEWARDTPWRRRLLEQAIAHTERSLHRR